MGKTQVKLTDEDVTYLRAKDMDVGQKIVGKYLKQITDKFKKPGYKLQLEDGSTAILNSTGQLAALFEKVPIGADVEVIYQGKTMIESGEWAGEKAHVFELFFETNDTDGLPV